MTRKERIARHNQNVKDAFAAAQRGEVINLSALIGGHEEIIADDQDDTADRPQPYSDNWKTETPKQENQP